MKSRYSRICTSLLWLYLLLQPPVSAADYWQGQPLPAAWQQYLQQSASLLQQDQQQLQYELELSGATQLQPAAKDKNFGLTGIASAAQAQAVLSYQTVSGGWSKRTDMSVARQSAQHFGSEPAYVPTFDNGATSSQIHWLADYYPQAPATLQPQLVEAMSRGVALLLQAQYPNGGFPQSFPLRGGYHDAITLNDDVMHDAMLLLWQVAHDKRFAMLAQAQRQQARQAFMRAVHWLLANQVQVDGQLTVWTAQHHPLSGAPVAARKFEQIALVSSESAHLLQLLLQTVPEYPGVAACLASAAKWFTQHAIYDKDRFRDDKGLHLIDKPGVVVWSRFYDIASGLPVFFDRDGKTYQDVRQISLERQQGYGWYQYEAGKFLRAYQQHLNRIKKAP